MTNKIKLAVAGVGNNISALVQGLAYYSSIADSNPTARHVGLREPSLYGFDATDVSICAAYDVRQDIIGQELVDAIFMTPNNYPSLGVNLPRCGTTVLPGLQQYGEEVTGTNEFTLSLRDSGAEVLLYSLPTGLQILADAYAKCALDAGVSLVNCTPEVMARNEQLTDAFQEANLALVGDDLQSHLGASALHGTILSLLRDRGLTLRSSYQINVGGNEDFRNLAVHGASKAKSKINALANKLGSEVNDAQLEVIPSAGHLSQLYDNKVAFINLEAIGWGGVPATIDLKLKVQDSSNAAGVIIDLVRIAGHLHRNAGATDVGITELAPLLKSPRSAFSIS